MSNLRELFEQLATVAPDVCKLGKFKRYEIGNYRFGFQGNGNLYTVCGNNFLVGQPAFDWLQGALQQGIKARGMYWELRYWKPRDKYQAEVANKTVWSNDATEALLSALIAALSEVK